MLSLVMTAGYGQPAFLSSPKMSNDLIEKDSVGVSNIRASSLLLLPPTGWLKDPLPLTKFILSARYCTVFALGSRPGFTPVSTISVNRFKAFGVNGTISAAFGFG